MFLTESYPGDDSYQEHLKRITDEYKHYLRTATYKTPDRCKESVFISSVSSKNHAIDEAEKILKEGAKTIRWKQEETIPVLAAAAKSSKIAALIKSILRH